jgi:hypothetical protein
MPDAGRDHIPAVDIPDDLHGGASCWLCSHLGLRQSSDYPAIVACQGGVATVDEGSTTAITNKHLYQSESHSNCPRLG